MRTDPTRLVADEILEWAETIDVIDDDDQLADWQRAMIDRLTSYATEDAGDDVDEQAEYIWMIDKALEAQLRRIQAARKITTAALLENVAEHGAIKLGDDAYRAAPKRGWEIHDLDQLLGWLQKVAPEDGIQTVFSLNDRNLRITALRSLARRDGQTAHPEWDDTDLDRYERLIVRTFAEYVDQGHGGLQLDTVYPGKAIWAQKLEHRQRDPNRKPKPRQEDDDGE